MLKLILLSYITSLFIGGCWSEFLQERAKVAYLNPKYVTNASVITRRMSRHEPYRTNFTATIFHPWGNNVTFSLTLQMKNGGDFKVHYKLCETLKVKWMIRYITLYSNASLEKCPFPPGTYAYRNMEIPPKNLPIPLLNGEYNSIMDFYLTATKEMLFSSVTIIHFDNLGSTHQEDSKKEDNKKENSKGDNKNKNKKDKKGKT